MSKKVCMSVNVHECACVCEYMYMYELWYNEEECDERDSGEADVLDDGSEMDKV